MTNSTTDDALLALGWGDDFARAFAACDDGSVSVGRVSRVDRGGWLTTETATGSQRARQHARYRRVADPLSVPTVGDWVVLREDPGGGPLVADTVLERRTVFVRKTGDDDRAQAQALAANIDTILIVVALDVPYNARRVDRFLTLALPSGAQPVIVLTKADVCDDVEAAVALAQDSAPAAEVRAISTRTGWGLDALDEFLVPGKTVVLLGQSGAGKSTLANHLSGDRDGMEAAEVRRDGKGRHTTSHRQLLLLPSGALLIDTPGLRSVGVWEDTLDEGAFTDIEELAEQCRFADCAHDEEPGCAVRAALADGSLAQERFDSYRTLRAEAQQVARVRELAARAQRGGRRRQ